MRTAKIPLGVRIVPGEGRRRCARCDLWRAGGEAGDGDTLEFSRDGAVPDWDKLHLHPRYKVALGEPRIRIYGDIAINTGTYTFSELRDDKPLIRPARFSFVHRQRDGRWLIIDHHSSAAPAAP